MTLQELIVRRLPQIVAVLSVVAILLVLTSAYLFFQGQATNERVDENQTAQVLGLRENQYINCVKSANALRRQVRREFVDLKRSVLIPVFSRVAATIPKGETSRRILTGTVVYLHKRIRTIENRIPNVDCLKRYPPLPGQSFSKPRPNRKDEDARSTSSRPSGPSDSNGGSGPSPSQPSGSGGGGDGDGSTQPSPGPSPTPPGPPPDPPPPPPPGTGNPPPQPPSQGPISGLGSGVNDTVDSAQNAAQGVLDDVQGTTCKLGVLC